MDAILSSLSGQLTDWLVYAAIAIVFVIGFGKCIMASRRCSRLLHKAVHQLESMTIKSVSQPVWQEPKFLGNTLQTSWRRFLVNAQQLDSRGINCNVADYINDDTVIYAHCHTQLGEVIPGILTSLGILGTFMGLVRGLGALDLSNAANTIDGISDMISGMNFAFGTSIAGCITSILFNILNHAAIGSAQNAIDDFHEAFTEFVMQQPLSDNVQAICQQEDRAAFLRHAVTEIGQHINEGVANAINTNMLPVTQSINQFISGETQHQLEGLNTIVHRFVESMNVSLSGQFGQLGQTLSAINRNCQVDRDAMNATMGAATGVIDTLQRMGDMMGRVSQRLEVYAAEAAQRETNGEDFTRGMQNVLSSMHGALQEQQDFLHTLRGEQQALENQMRDYANWSARVLQAVENQSGTIAASTDKTALAMRESGRLLSESCSSFADTISVSMTRSLSQFETSMNNAFSLLDSRVNSLKHTGPDTASVNGAADGCVAALSRLQRMLQDINDQLENTVRALNGTPKGA